MKYKQGPHKRVSKEQARCKGAEASSPLRQKSHRCEVQAIMLERTKHEAQSRLRASLLLASLPKKLTKSRRMKRRVESPVARKPKARCEPLRLKSRRSPDKVLTSECLRRKVLSHESRRLARPLRLKSRRSPNKILTCESLRRKVLSRESRRLGATPPAKEPKVP